MKGWSHTRRYNPRVRGATKTVVGGIQFDSKLEAHMYSKLCRLDWLVVKRQHKFVLQPSFRSTVTGKHIREIAWVVDFYLPQIGMIIDPKGFATEMAKVKIKMMQYAIFKELYPIDHIILPSNQRECDAALSHVIMEGGKAGLLP